MDSPNPTQSPSSVRTVLGSNQSDADADAESVLLSLFSLPDSSPILDCSSFDGVLEKALASISRDELVRDHLVDRALKFASLLKRYSRKRACAHNSTSWFLPSELTFKVFSMLDQKSLMKAAACCTMFNNYAMNPTCYSHIDLKLSNKYADAKVVGPMIHRAGTELRSLKVVRVRQPYSRAFQFRTSFLTPLVNNHGLIGSHLKSLRLYNLSLSARYSLRDALLVCPNITELKIVGPLFDYSCVRFNAAEELFTSLTGKCRLLEHLLLDIYDHRGIASLVEFVTSCPNLTSLTLKDYALTDEMALIIAQSCHKMAYLNLEKARIQGHFFGYLELFCQENPLKYLILRNSDRLQERALVEFCNSLLSGNCKSIQHIDVSSDFHIGADGDRRWKNPKLPLERLKEKRSDLTFVAEFPLRSSAKSYRVCDEEDLRLMETMDAYLVRCFERDYYPDRDDDEFSLSDAQELIDSWR